MVYLEYVENIKCYILLRRTIFSSRMDTLVILTITMIAFLVTSNRTALSSCVQMGEPDSLSTIHCFGLYLNPKIKKSRNTFGLGR